MSATEGDGRVARLRVLADGIAARLGGVPAVRLLAAVFDTYDQAGGGLVAGGLANSALIALLPGLLLVLSVFGLVVTDPAIQEQLVDAIATAIPPLEDFAETALKQVSAGAVPSGIIAVIGLVWASSRFYSALDYAISKIFRQAKQRNEIVRTVRGVLLTLLLVAFPIFVVFAGAVVQAILDLIPDANTRGGIADLLVRLAAPVATFVLFVVATVMVYRNVPAETVPAIAWRRPALVVGLLLAGFTQLFAIIAPLMTRISALYGAIVAVFALLAWLSIGFNMLLIGAAWTRVRALAATSPDAPPATDGGAEERKP
jgi:YihY family inner membrane protein